MHMDEIRRWHPEVWSDAVSLEYQGAISWQQYWDGQ